MLQHTIDIIVRRRVYTHWSWRRPPIYHSRSVDYLNTSKPIAYSSALGLIPSEGPFVRVKIENGRRGTVTNAKDSGEILNFKSPPKVGRKRTAREHSITVRFGSSDEPRR